MTLLSDTNLDLARKFGIAYKMPTELSDKMRSSGVKLQKASDSEYYLLPAPAVFLVDQDGEIRFQYVNPDYKVRIAPDTILEAIRR